MNPRWQRLRAGLASDRAAYEGRLTELNGLNAAVDTSPAELAQIAVALHHAYGAIEAALSRVAREMDGGLRHAYAVSWDAVQLEDLRARTLHARASVLEDLDRLDALLASIANAEGT